MGDDSIKKMAMGYCDMCIEAMLGHGNITKNRLPNGLDVESYRAGFEDCISIIERLLERKD